MRVPISWALTYPERGRHAGCRGSTWPSRFRSTFEPPDPDAFRCLALARAAGEAGGTAPCVLNAANEVAVAAFLAGGVGFPDIAERGRARARAGRRRAARRRSSRCSRPTRRARALAGDAVTVAA